MFSSKKYPRITGNGYWIKDRSAMGEYLMWRELPDKDNPDGAWTKRSELLYRENPTFTGWFKQLYGAVKGEELFTNEVLSEAVKDRHTIPDKYKRRMEDGQ